MYHSSHKGCPMSHSTNCLYRLFVIYFEFHTSLKPPFHQFKKKRKQRKGRNMCVWDSCGRAWNNFNDQPQSREYILRIWEFLAGWFFCNMVYHLSPVFVFFRRTCTRRNWHARWRAVCFSARYRRAFIIQCVSQLWLVHVFFIFPLGGHKTRSKWSFYACTPHLIIRLSKRYLRPTSINGAT